MECLDSFLTLLDHPKNQPEPPQISKFVIFGQIWLETSLEVKNKQQLGLHERNWSLEQIKHELIYISISLQYAN